MILKRFLHCASFTYLSICTIYIFSYFSNAINYLNFVFVFQSSEINSLKSRWLREISQKSLTRIENLNSDMYSPFQDLVNIIL